MYGGDSYKTPSNEGQWKFSPKGKATYSGWASADVLYGFEAVFENVLRDIELAVGGLRKAETHRPENHGFSLNSR